jgi:hypothetical protein
VRALAHRHDSGSRRRTPVRATAAFLLPAAVLAGQVQLSARETVAAIDPALVAGRGAQLGLVEQEAENATTNGTILPFDTSAYTLSGARRRAGKR